MLVLFEFEEAVSENQYQLASKAWSAFRSPSPDNWHALLKKDTTSLPFLHDAIIRMLEEYPSCTNGLSRTAHQALKLISTGEISHANLFEDYQQTEESRFLGDSSFWVILNALLESCPALIQSSDGKSIISPFKMEQKLTVTNKGMQVLSGECNWLDIVSLNHWIGGVHLTADHFWCWDKQSASLINSP